MQLLALLRVRSSDLLAYWQATDEFDSSGGNSALIIGVILFIAIGAIVLTGLKAWESMRSRGREIRSSAQKQGFDFAERGHRTLQTLRFDVFLEATGFEATSIVSKKRPDGKRVFAFDYQLINEFELYKTPDGKTHRRRRGDPNTIGGAAVGREVDHLDVVGAGATVNISSFLRNVVVQPFNWHVSSASRLPAEQAISGLDPDFMSLYRVRADDRAFAARLLNPSLTKLLVRTGGQFGLEVRGNNLLLFANDIDASDMCDMALLAGICVDLIDEELLEAYPEVVGIESDGSPRLAVRDVTAKEPSFPEVEQPRPNTGPVLPDTLSGRSVPVLSSDPQLPIEESTLPDPSPAEQAAPSVPAAPTVPSAPDTPEAPAEPAPATYPEPDSVDWSL